MIYLGMGELVRELRRQNPQPSSSRELQFQQFAGQVMEEVGLQRWVVQQGGIRMVVRQAHLLICLLCPLHTKICFIVFQIRASRPLDSSQPKVDISDVD